MLRHAIRELDACGLTPAKRKPGADRSRLTPQERAIAQLAAAGRTNREVAAELLLSLKTVERHLTHVYRKLASARAPSSAERSGTRGSTRRRSSGAVPRREGRPGRERPGRAVEVGAR
jgi:DNA-binding NarL/FixJ family response regulator